MEKRRGQRTSLETHRTKEEEAQAGFDGRFTE
jgi:hypothetical protein